jgi:6-pyruvoyltetrahydropterin/6-carboxytetrahydropterin synthase
MFRVSREIDFCYGHRLLQYEGKCRHLHGHNGRAIITLETASLDGQGMILHRDDPIVPILEKQGEPMYLLDANPTAENIAKLIADKSRELGVPVVEVRLWETPHCFATYCPE